MGQRGASSTGAHHTGAWRTGSPLDESPSRLVAGAEAAVTLRWPLDASARQGRVEVGHPSLLLVPLGEKPPADLGLLEDWIRLPASSEDIELRLAGLVRRVGLIGGVTADGHVPPTGDQQRSPTVVTANRPRASWCDDRGEEVWLDQSGRAGRGSDWVALSEIEAALLQVLLAGAGEVTPREVVMDSAWPGAHPSRNVLDVHMMRLRRRLEPLGVAVRTVRRRGFVLDLCE